MKIFIPRFLAAAAFVAMLMLVGTMGYMRIESWSFSDAWYMTATTITAVGYDEVHPLSQAGRNLTMLLIVGGITGLGLWFALLTSLIVELDLANVLRRRKSMKAIAELKDHILVCGAGRTGRRVVQEVVFLDHDVVVMERDGSKIDELRELYPDILVVEGDATQDHHLEEAGIRRAQGLMACLSSDMDNVYLCLSARELHPGMTVIARAYEEESMDKLYRAGATHVVNPNLSGANRMAAMMLRPSVVSFLDVATRSPDLALRIEQTTIAPGSPVAGQTLAEAKIPQPPSSSTRRRPPCSRRGTRSSSSGSRTRSTG
jgi:voltage-gated potassium channel